MAGLPKHAARWVVVCVIMLGLAAAVGDSFRQPKKQVTAKLYVSGIRTYRAAIWPISKKWVRCRFYPTCAEYSREAVQLHGIRKGISLTIRRFYRCRSNVRRGTWDPVPPVQIRR